MDIVRIHDKTSNIVLYLDKNKYFGYKFNNDNTIEKVDKNVFKYFDFLVCSNDFKRLADEGEYNVILDNETNFKHYFKGGSEDYQMFCLNNGKDALSYNSKDGKNNLKNISFLIGNLVVTASLSSFLILSNYQIYINANKNNTEIHEEVKQDKVISLITNQDISVLTI